MKVILIDDEQHAINYLEYQLLKTADDIDIAGKYLDADEGKEAILREDIDVVFLDIQMPEINGIELAEMLLEKKPQLFFVFVTAHNDYAIKAFELNALDYIMKPIGKARLAVTVERVRKRIRDSAVDEIPSTKLLCIQMFEQPSIFFDGEKAIPIRWRTTKSQELFFYLLQHRRTLLRKSVLMELLWPDVEPDKAIAQLYTTIYHIRKILEPFGEYIQISNATDGYILNLQNVSLDCEEWEKGITMGPPISKDNVKSYEKLMTLYEGEYLKDFDYFWLEGERQRLLKMWLCVSMEMARIYESSNKFGKAIETYSKICDRAPLEEEAHFALMKRLASEGNHIGVHRQFRQLADIVMEELGIEPSPHIIDWYDQWNRKNKE